MRSLGDSYVRDEFKRHQKIDNPLQIVAFHSQWQMYLEQFKGGKDGISIRGKSLEPEMFDKVSKECGRWKLGRYRSSRALLPSSRSGEFSYQSKVYL